MTVEPDGVSMTLDPARSDLMVDAELGRFADERPRRSQAERAGEPGRAGSWSPPRRCAGGWTGASRRRTSPTGTTRRTGGEIPPAVRLLLASSRRSRRARPPLKAARMLVLTLPDAGLLDGLLQHPATSPWLGDRLGPTAVAISDDQLEPLRKALKELGIGLKGD